MGESNMQDGDVMHKQKPFTSIVSFHFAYKWMYPISFDILSSYCTFLQLIHFKAEFFSFTIFHSCSDTSHDVSCAAAAASAEGECSGLLLAQAVLPSVTAA